MKRAISIFMCCLFVLFTGLILCGQAEAAGRGKAASSALLPRELKNISVKDDFIPSSGKEAGVIRTVVGHVVVSRDNLRQAYFAAAGDKLYEKDVLFTLKKSRCRFKLHNEDTVTLGENARLGITSFADDRKSQEKRSAFDMARGKAMFFTMRLFKHKGSSMTVSTPTAVAGVRGTKFGVEVIELDEAPSAALPLLVADASNTNSFRHLAQANPLPPVKTNVYVYEGMVDVTSTATGETKTLQDGQGVTAGSGGLGSPFQTPKDTAKQFEEDTSVEPPAIIGLGTEGGFTDQNPLNTGPLDTSSLTQNLNTLPLVPTTTREGYFVGMLTRDWGGGEKGYDFTLMSETIQNSSNAKAEGSYYYGEGGPFTDFVRIEGTGGSRQVVEYYCGSENISASGLPQPMQQIELGSNANMEWGSWTQPSAMTINEGVYYFDNKGYYVWGDRTVTMPASIEAHYSGPALGTVWGGIEKSGSFSMDVSLSGASGSINNFQVWVGGEGVTGFSGGTGSFTGSSFSVTSSGGEVNNCVDGICGGFSLAKGAFYGPNAEYTGGVWQVVNEDVWVAANGMFQGAKGASLPPPALPRPLTHEGHLTGILSYAYVMSPNPEVTVPNDIYITETLGNFDAIVEFDGVAAGSATIDGTGGDVKKITELFNSDPLVDPKLPQSLQRTEIGYNAYMEWGSWSQPALMNVRDYGSEGYTGYKFDNPGYYIWGDVTTDTQMTALKTAGLSATYSGNAYGTYWTDTGGANMTGSFSTKIDIPVGSVPSLTAFGFSVSGGGQSVSYSGGTGSFTEPTSQFQITGGSWTMSNTNEIINGAIAGSLYGDQAQAIGGRWGVSGRIAGTEGNNKHAVGIFQGTR